MTEPPPQFMLAPAIARGLSDRLYDKRKTAALEVEKLVREAVLANDRNRVTAVVVSLVQDFAYSTSPNARNGGLIALAAVSIALGSTELDQYLDDIVPPVTTCFTDPDSRVRYYACEAMYNVAKVGRGDILKYFNEVFDALCKIVADPEPTVRTGAELLDNLIKDIVREQSSFYPQEGQLELGPEMNTDDNVRRFPAEPFMPPAPGSIPLLNGMKPSTFNLPRFIPLLSERIKTVNPLTRIFLVQWIVTLDATPELELIGYLPELMDGLFAYLSDSSVRVMTLNCLSDLLKELQEVIAIQKERGTLNVRGRKKSNIATTDGVSSEEKERPPGSNGDGSSSQTVPNPEYTSDRDGSRPLSPTGSQRLLDETEDTIYRAKSSLSMASSFYAHGGKVRAPEPVNPTSTIPVGTLYTPGQGITLRLGDMMDVLAPHLMSSDAETQSAALRWVHQFVDMFGEHLLPFTPELLGAILPSLAHGIEPIRNLAMETNAKLFKLVADVRLSSEAPSNGTADLAASISSLDGVRPDLLDIQATMETLTSFESESEQTRVAGMDWLIMLHRKAPWKVLTSEDTSVLSLLKALSDPSEEVVRRDLQLLAQISHYSDEAFFKRLLVNLLSMFASDRRLLETKGALIIRQLCLNLSAERIYTACAEILERGEDLEFASSMVQNLNLILITAPELSEVRRRLKNLESRDGLALFAVLYRSWCHNPVSTFALCLLAQAYEHAANLLQIFAELEITIALLVQVDKLVQLIESPVFTYLRLHLLEPARYPHLFRCLFGILMLLPQSSAFVTLRNRLNSVNSMVMLYGQMAPTGGPAHSSNGGHALATKSSSGRLKPADTITLRWHELLTHFRNVQMRHERARRNGQRIGPFGAEKSTRRRGTSRKQLADGEPEAAGASNTEAIGQPSSQQPLEQEPPSFSISEVSAADTPAPPPPVKDVPSSATAAYMESMRSATPAGSMRSADSSSTGGVDMALTVSASSTTSSQDKQERDSKSVLAVPTKDSASSGSPKKGLRKVSVGFGHRK